MKMDLISMRVSDMSLDELVMLAQGFGREIDHVREQRAYVRRLIAQRLAANTGSSSGAGDSAAPGATIEAGVAG